MVEEKLKSSVGRLPLPQSVQTDLLVAQKQPQRKQMADQLLSIVNARIVAQEHEFTKQERFLACLWNIRHEIENDDIGAAAEEYYVAFKIDRTNLNLMEIRSSLKNELNMKNSAWMNSERVDSYLDALKGEAHQPPVRRQRLELDNIFYVNKLWNNESGELSIVIEPKRFDCFFPEDEAKTTFDSVLQFSGRYLSSVIVQGGSGMLSEGSPSDGSQSCLWYKLCPDIVSRLISTAVDSLSAELIVGKIMLVFPPNMDMDMGMGTVESAGSPDIRTGSADLLDRINADPFVGGKLPADTRVLEITNVHSSNNRFSIALSPNVFYLLRIQIDA